MLWLMLIGVAILMTVLILAQEGIESVLDVVSVLVLFGIPLALVLNLFCAGIAHNVKVSECNLQKVSETYLAQTIDDYDSKLYYRCENDNGFAPKETALDSNIEVRKGPVAKLEIYDNKTTGKQNWFCFFDAGGQRYVFTIPENNVSLGLDKTAAR